MAGQEQGDLAALQEEYDEFVVISKENEELMQATIQDLQQEAATREGKLRDVGEQLAAAQAAVDRLKQETETLRAEKQQLEEQEDSLSKTWSVGRRASGSGCLAAVNLPAWDAGNALSGRC